MTDEGARPPRASGLGPGPWRRRRASVGAGAIFLGTAMPGMLGCVGDAPAPEGWTVRADTLPGGVVRVRNVPPATGIDPTWIVEPELRIGSMEGEGPDAFGQIKAVAVLPDARIAVLDAQAQEIRIFAPDGEHGGTLGRRGEGPGELADANGMVTGPDGLLRVNDPRNSRLSVFDPDEGFLGSARVDVYAWGFLWNAVVGDGGRIYEPTLALLGDDPWNVIKVLDPDGAWADTVRLRPSEPSTGEETPGTYRYARGLSVVPFWPRGARTLDPRGFFWAVPPNMNEYRVVQTTFEGDTLLTFESQRTPRPVSAEERDSVIVMMRDRTGGEELDWSRIPDEKPLVQGLTLDDRGRIWVRVAASDTAVTYDVFGRDGRYRGTAVTTLGVPSYWAPTILGDRFYTLHTDELGVPYLVRARIRESGTAVGAGGGRS